MSSLRDIAIDWLAERGFDGLFNSDIECGCGLADLMPCDEPSVGCCAGVKKIAGPESETPGAEIYGPQED